MNKHDYSKQAKLAHTLSVDNKMMLKSANLCACFYCGTVFNYSDIKNWISGLTDESDTALCPYCQIDSVIPKDDRYRLTPDFLNYMYQRWFVD